MANTTKYIDKYKQLKDAGAILWNIKGKKIDQSLTKHYKEKISRAYREFKKLGSGSVIYHPRKKAHETPLAYTRRVNRIRKNSGIASTDISGLVIEKNLADGLKVDTKNDKIFIDVKKGNTRFKKQFLAIDRVSFNLDPRDYLTNQLIDINDMGLSEYATVSPMHSHWPGKGAQLSAINRVEEFIDRVTGWAYQYQSDMIDAIESDENSKETKNAIDKYNYFLTGLLLEDDEEI